MKQMWRIGCTAVVVAATMALTGCGSDNKAAINGVSGVVADGYLKGAIVFLDKNGDKVWQEGEPKTVTGEGGKYTFTDLAQGSLDATNFPVVVQVTTDTINEDNGQKVAKEYYLTAPAGKPEVITPITTMIQSKIETGTTEADAVAAVKNDLGVTVDLYKDFVAESKTTSTDNAAYVKIYNAAQVVATKIADNLAVIKASSDASSNLSVNLSAAVATVTNTLTTIAALDSVKATTVMTPAAVATAISTATGMSTIAAGDIKAAIDQQQAAISVPVSSSFKDVVTSGTYWVDSSSYGFTKLASDGVTLTETIKYFDYDTKTWLDTRPANWGTETIYKLTGSGWKVGSEEASDGTVVFNSDGTATWTSKTDGSSMSVSMVAFDIAGKSFEKYLYSSSPAKVAAKVAGSTTTGVIFPDGSKAYRMTQKQLNDTYSLASYLYDLNGTQEESNRLGYWDGSKYVYATKLADLPTMFEDKTDGYALYVHTDGQSLSLQAKFSGTNTVNFYVNNSAVSAGSGTWEDKSVSGQTLRIINIPDSVKTTYNITRLPFFVVKDGYVMQGDYVKAGTLRTGSYDFNKTAFDALLAYFNQMLAPSTGKSTAKNISMHYFGM